MRHNRGFTLIELMIAIGVVAILTAVALPSYQAYLMRSRVPVALDSLSALATRMEQCFQDTGTYAGCAACNSASIAQPVNFTVACPAGERTATTFKVHATGSGVMSGYEYTIDQAGNRVTAAHPKGTNANCWTTRGGSVCDS